MTLLDSLERRFGRFAIPGLIRFVALMNGFVFLLLKLDPGFLQFINLNGEAVLKHHEYWRLFTFIFIPGTDSFLFIFFVCLFLFWIGEGLERAWGAFRLNLFYLVGIIGTAVAALFFGAEYSNLMLNASLFFAFAWFYPDERIYILFIIPARVKHMAWFSAALIGLQALAEGTSYRMALLASFANYLIFFGPAIFRNLRRQKEISEHRQRFERAPITVEEPLYQCVVCHRNDRQNPELQFRVGRDGNDYCLEHLPKA